MAESMSIHKTFKPIAKGLHDIEFIDKLKVDGTEAFAKGKITDIHYNLLNEKVSNTVSNNASKNEDR
jgi:hypothetical protein